MGKNTKLSFYPDSDRAWEIIEMGGDIDSLYPETWDVRIPIPKSKLLPGEQFEWLPQPLGDYGITSMGRVFSGAQLKPKQLVTVCMVNVWYITLRGKKVQILKELDDRGWSITHGDLRDIYMSNKWKFQMYNKETGTYTLHNGIKHERK